MILLVLICGLLGAFFATGLGTPRRVMALLALAALFSGAGIYELLARGAQDLLVLWVALVFLLAGSGWFALEHFAPLIERQGPLLAGGEPTPRNICGAVGGDGLLMIFGQDGIIGHGDGPFTPVRAGTCPALSLTRTKDGLLVNGFGFDSDGNVTYKIRNNDFDLVLRGFLKGARPDDNTLQVVDETGRPEIAIRYLNPNTVQITGAFRCGDTSTVRIADTVRVGNKSPAPSCTKLKPGALYGISYSDRGP